MKKNIILMALLSCCLSLTTGCKEDDDHVPGNGCLGDENCPAHDWEPIKDYHVIFSQTIELEASAMPVPNPDKKDKVAVFINDECRDVTHPYDDPSGDTYAHLTVRIHENEEGQNLNVEMRYHSNASGAVYRSESFRFVVDQMLFFGKYGQPLKWTRIFK